MHLSIKQASNQEQLNEILLLRKEVFCDEQNVPLDLEIDQYDQIRDDVIHFGLYDDNNLVACLRLILTRRYIKIGRVASKQATRNQGHITYLFTYLVKYCFDNLRNIKELYLESQEYIIPMYEKFGFKTEGETFLDAGINHKKMLRYNNNPFIYSHTNKRYYTFNHYLQNTYHSKVGRVMIEGGFSCPNIDGTKGRGGCTYCSAKGSGDFAGPRGSELLEQYTDGFNKLKQKWPNAKGIAYFQAYTNTYAPLDVLKERYEVFLDAPDCVAIAISTRPDCLDEEIIAYLSELNKTKDIILELGLQTINDKSADLINRCHTLQEFDDCLELLDKYNLKPVVHVINGLPGENKQDMIATVKYLANKPISGIKIHLLHILEHTKMARQYRDHQFELMTEEDYIDTVCEQIAILPDHMIIHRLTGDGDSTDLIGPLWSLRKTAVLNNIDKELVTRNLYQGCNYEA